VGVGYVMAGGGKGRGCTGMLFVLCYQIEYGVVCMCRLIVNCLLQVCVYGIAPKYS
jgi:hypothetical protein